MGVRVILSIVFAVACMSLLVARADDKSAPRNPLLDYALPTKYTISGHIEERVPAGSYVYLRLRERSGSTVWLVSLSATTPTAADVNALIVGRAEHFHSRKLERDFSPLLFAAIRAAEQVAPGLRRGK